MTPLDQAPAALLFAKKIFTFQSGALIVMAAPGSVTLTGLFSAIIADTPLKDLVLPLVVGGVCLAFYFIVFLIDFFSGVKASKVEAENEKGYFQSGKAWSSIYKIFVVFLIVIWASFFSVLSAIAAIPGLPTFFMMASATVAIMATLFDCHSIGENQKRITGKKARIFEWLEGKGNAIDAFFTKKLKSPF